MNGAFFIPNFHFAEEPQGVALFSENSSTMFICRRFCQGLMMPPEEGLFSVSLSEYVLYGIDDVLSGERFCNVAIRA